MHFHLEERRAWIRTSTHSVVWDRDPDFDRFAANKTGMIARLIRIWQDDPESQQPLDYLGSVYLGPLGYRRRDLRRLFQRVAKNCLGTGESPTTVRRELSRLLKSSRRS